MLDGDAKTYFHSAYPPVANEWIQIDMLKEIEVKKIIVLRKFVVFTCLEVIADFLLQNSCQKCFQI